jgi:serine/threonine protein kinase|nr:protein kinase [Candidatus Acidoferrales bacterium]
MPLVNGTKLGPYEIISPLGAGGMGEVYRARDSKLGREVALKVISEQFANDAERMARFEREAKVLASLNHPNIAHIYGLEDSGGVRALVMELVEGQTLAERIARGPIPLEETLSTAKQIAEALEYAHERGIVHRDLKPANVKITPDGAVKVLDFGLAKAIEETSAAESISNSPTLSMGATRAGVVLGTAAYMSPEQAKGKSADRRADIWSFGVVLYEMLSGKQMYGGETAPETLAHVITKEPSWEGLPASTPAAIRNLLERCLTKDPKARLQAIGEARIIIERYLANPGASTSSIERIAPEQPASRSILPWSIAAIAVVTALLVGWAPWRHSSEATRAMRLAFAVPPNLAFNDAQSDSAVISPDGQKIAFTATSQDGKWQLWVRSLDSSDAKLLPGTDDPLEPFWSPDSKSIAFGSQGKLKRVDLVGGSAQVLCDAARMTGGAWSTKGVILFGSDYGSVLYQVPATGGEPKAVTIVNAAHGDFGHTSPSFLPDANHFLFRVSMTTNPQGVWVGSLNSPEVKQLLTDNTSAVYASPGYLIFVRNSALMAQAFDAGSSQLKGEAMPIIPQAITDARGPGRYSVSDNGILVWQSNWKREYQLLWFDREGKQIGAVGPVMDVTSGQEPHLSPDGKRLVIKRDNNIWVIDLARDTGIRLTSVFSQLPMWTPDGSHIIFQSSTDEVGKRGIVRKAANGVGELELLLNGVNFPHEISPDGRFVLFTRRGVKTRLDIWALPLFGDRKEFPLMNSAFDEREPQISPDGRWLAYCSDESGNYEIYVRPFSADGKVGDDKRRVSTNGGSEVKWRANGQELFYVAGDGQLMAVPVKTSGAGIEFGAPKALFKTRLFGQQAILHEFDVTPDGQRFIVGTLIGEPKAPPPTVILNWTAELIKK